MLKIFIKYHTDITRIEKIAVGDWIDLRAAEDVTLKKGDFKIISLGVSMKLPEGYEAHLLPRSSTCKKFSIVSANSQGIIDNSYCGDNDVWGMPVLAVADTFIPKDTRICQFRIEKTMPEVEIVEVDKLDDKDRGGFGSTGSV